MSKFLNRTVKSSTRSLGDLSATELRQVIGGNDVAATTDDGEADHKPRTIPVLNRTRTPAL